VNLAEFRYQLTEGGVIQALRDIYNHYHARTGDSYIKTSHYEKHKVFQR